MLVLCRHGFEALLARELRAEGAAVLETGPGWAVAHPQDDQDRRYDPCFAHLQLPAASEFRGSTLNALAHQVAEFFLETLRGEVVDTNWPCVFLAAEQVPGLSERVAGVQKAFCKLARKRVPRVLRLATMHLPRSAGCIRGLFVYFTDFGRMFVSREAWPGGQRRMPDDPLAPSRSYLKIEEAYAVFGRAPLSGETVCDLGAAPGGWSYSAAKRGARVIAIDNGRLKGGAVGHPCIQHRREDAFKFVPPDGHTFDWMLCDLVESPQQVLQRLVVPWLEHRWCRRFIVMLKFGHADALDLLRDVRASDSPLMRHTARLLVRHLYHDREEFTLMGELKS